MERIFLSALLGMVVVGAIFCSSPLSKAAPLPEDYPLVCRGGGSLVIGIAPGEANIGFSFTRGTKPADEGLAPGDCSWKDRGMFPNEPNRVSQHVKEGSESLKVGGTLAAENRWYEELHSSDSYWTFMVSNNGRGQLIATSARPNKAQDISPTARVPSAIGQILRRDLPTARALDNETPKVIVLEGSGGSSSRSQVMKGSAGGQSMNLPLAPRALSREEKTKLLKLAGLEPLDETPTAYVTLTPQRPHVDERGSLLFYAANRVDSRFEPIAEFLSSKGDFSYLAVMIEFENKGIYLLSFTVYSESYDKFGVVTDPEGGDTGTPIQTFMDEPKKWQRLNVIVEVAGPGVHFFHLQHKAKSETYWYFGSCDVTAWKT